MRKMTGFVTASGSSNCSIYTKKQGKLGTVAYPKPGLLLEDVLADVLHLL